MCLCVVTYEESYAETNRRAYSWKFLGLVCMQKEEEEEEEEEKTQFRVAHRTYFSLAHRVE